jgi:Zn-dependent peptidase ImmA (M78 family)
MKASSTAVKQAKRLLAQAGINFETMDVTKDCSIDVEKVATKLKIKIVLHLFEKNISGVFFKKDGNLFIGVNETHGEKRNRFTIAHEIGHYLLHSSDALHYDDQTKLPLAEAYFRAENVDNPNEREANHFAAELLMPGELIERCIQANIKSTRELAVRFKVSEQAMTYRLINLGYL